MEEGRSMATKVIVLIADRDDPKHGEVAVLESTAEAERLVETCLEAGYDPERIRVFAGAEMEAQISQRPKVDLLAEEADKLAHANDSPVGEEVEPVKAPSEEEAELTHTSGEEEDEATGGRSQDEVQPVHALSEAGAAGWENWSGASPASNYPPQKPMEFMPELLH
jgi:hypothetical protein